MDFLDNGITRLKPLTMAEVAAVLEDDFLGRIRRYRCGSGTLRMNVALAELPRFDCLPGAGVQPGHQSGIIIAPSLDYMERAWLDARRDDLGGRLWFAVRYVFGHGRILREAYPGVMHFLIFFGMFPPTISQALLYRQCCCLGGTAVLDRPLVI